VPDSIEKIKVTTKSGSISDSSKEVTNFVLQTVEDLRSGQAHLSPLEEIQEGENQNEDDVSLLQEKKVPKPILKAGSARHMLTKSNNPSAIGTSEGLLELQSDKPSTQLKNQKQKNLQVTS